MTAIYGTLGALLTLLAAIVAAAAGLFALSVLLSYSIAWYDRVNADPAIAAQRRHALAARLLLAEFACLLLTLLLRPLGWLPARLPARPSRRPPVVLLHGLFQNRSSLLVLQRRLRAAGYDRLISINTPPWRDLEGLVDTVAATVEAAHRACGGKVLLVGHSMGGILARCYLQLRDGARHTAACITIATPHHGSKLAPFAISRLGRALLPGSALLDRLQAAPLPDDVPFTAIYSRHDNIIVPPGNARLAGADNIELSGMGHTAMLFSRQTAQAVVAALSSGESPAREDR